MPTSVTRSTGRRYSIVWSPAVLGSYTVSATSAHTTHNWYADLFGTTFSCAPLHSPTITFHVIPTPSACAVLGLGTLLGARRRRLI